MASMLKKNLACVWFGLFSIIFVGIVFVLVSQLHTVNAEQYYSAYSIKMISSETMAGMSNMSGMHGMAGMSNMSGMREMSDRLGISSNEKIPIFLEWMTMLTACLVGIPFAWVIISQRRK
ncbi:MAG: hypothetical protein WBV92_05730 [Nitrosotalea sp.]